MACEQNKINQGRFNNQITSALSFIELSACSIANKIIYKRVLKICLLMLGNDHSLHTQHNVQIKQMYKITIKTNEVCNTKTTILIHFTLKKIHILYTIDTISGGTSSGFFVQYLFL